MTKDRIKSILATISQAKEEHPNFADLLEIQEELIQVQAVIRVIDLPFRPEIENRWVGRWLTGSPAMSWEDLSINWGSFHFLLEQIGEIFAKHQPDTSVVIRTLVEKTWNSRQALVRSWYSSEKLEPTVARIIAGAAQPWLTRAAEAVAPYLEPALWDRAICPVCGGLPDLGILTDQSGERNLCCSRCDSIWQYTQMDCPFCETDRLKNMTNCSSNNRVHNLHVCEQCRSYLKIIDLRDSNHPLDLTIERIVTLPLDAIAQKNGFGLRRAC